MECRACEREVAKIIAWGMCQPCYKKWYREKNSERLNAQSREWKKTKRDVLLPKRRERYAANPEIDQVRAQKRKQMSAWREQNLEHARARERAYAKANAEKIRARERNTHDPVKERAKVLRRLYGLTPDGAQALLSAQGGACAICRQTLSVFGRGKGKANVDHCHNTGKVRGILCTHCNTALGLLRERPANFLSAIQYLIRAAS